jgi:hypothetical protein
MDPLPQTPTPRLDAMVGKTPSQGSQLVETQESEIDLFGKLNSYPFSTDVEFAKGLSIILGHPDIPATEAEIDCEDDLVLQAKCFYFSRYVPFNARCQAYS